ncbi:SpoIIE family protein phosphatase [Cesiribacter andamanensis]|uniref:Respiratory response protein A n=1 Tax=Cesiribacter andamanensis AMV16 TaxID=1279009 RepID=M7N405_9BACT|nr:SpoIIE family protein phosphatase [Cesiribacter andamanensis]EMR02022.1 respiratory response protein A [Cesiribacter andamanensis AMV16]
MHLLIIDDNREDREVMKRYLEKGASANGSGLSFDETSTLAEAFSILHQNKPDCVLLDYMLPDMDGLQALSLLQQEFDHSLCIIFLTGSGNEFIAAKAFKAGAYDYIQKSFIGPEFYSIVQNAVTKAQQKEKEEKQRQDLVEKNRQLREAKMLLEERQRELIRMQLQTSITMIDIEQENQRRAEEIDAAKRLQMYMLPVQPPKHAYIQMSMYLQTYAEVGGDYYDYLENDNGDFYIIIGDATGHGVMAGTVVAVAKSYFHTFGPSMEPADLLQQMSDGIRNLKVRNLYMGLTLLRIRDHELTIASSGMPPLLRYRADTNTIDTLVFKGPFMGSSIAWDIRTETFSMAAGDGLLLLSDGLIELYNKDREQLGIEPVAERYLQSARMTAEEVIQNMVALKLEWTTGDVNDDITLISLKFLS